ncbi:MAG: ABC transporter ATP-binding protein/permease [Acetatifactor sp.]|nr:ABC transporter ATP-binding protein/permease [Acetatifactor sp.]
MKSFKRYLNIFKGVKIPWIVYLVLLAIGIGESYLFLEQTTLTADIIDASQNAINGSMLVKFIVVLVLGAVISIVNSYGKGWLSQKIILGVRTRLWNKLMRLPSRYYDSENGDSLVSRVTTDSEQCARYFDISITLITAVYAAVVSVHRMYGYSPKLTEYTLLTVPVVLVLSWAFGKLNFFAQNKYQLAFASSLAYLVEHTRNLQLIKAARTEYAEQQEGRKRFHRQFRVGYLTAVTNSSSVMLMEVLACVVIVIAFVMGGQLVQAGEITTGRLVGFYSLSTMLGIRLMQVLLLYGDIKAANGRIQKVAELLETPDEGRDGIELDIADADIVVDHVSFSYQETPVLKDVTCRIPRGEITAIIGDNGAGKSTLFKLLERMYDPDSGSVRFGKTDVRTFELTSWRQSLAIVSQDKPLLSGSVRDNILYGVRRKVSEDELIQVAKMAKVYDFVMATPGGFDAPVGPGGGNFSGGQRQCIAIARAMMRNPDYLLLDEATSNLDARNEQLVSQALTNLMRGRTTVMIAHNYSATRGAGHIIVLRDGKVEAEGTPEELLQTSEFYREFVNKAG